MTTVTQTTTTTAKPATAPKSKGASRRRRDAFAAVVITSLTLLMLFLWLVPLAYMFLTSVKKLEQMQNGEILPKSPATVDDEGEELEMLAVHMPDGTSQGLDM